MKKQVFRFTPSSSKKTTPAETDTRAASDEPPVDAVSVKIIAVGLHCSIVLFDCIVRSHCSLSDRVVRCLIKLFVCIVSSSVF